MVTLRTAVAALGIVATVACATTKPVYRPSDSASRARDLAPPTGGGPRDPNVTPQPPPRENFPPQHVSPYEPDHDRDLRPSHGPREGGPGAVGDPGGPVPAE